MSKLKGFSIIRNLTILTIVILSYQLVWPQSTRITGIVMDSISHLTLPNISVRIANSHRGTITNSEGKFKITVDKGKQQLILTGTGFQSTTIYIPDTTAVEIKVFLLRSYTTLTEVIVNSRIKKYSNKNNPAVDLIRKVIENKSKNGPAADSNRSYQQYEKVRILLDKAPKFVYQNLILKKFHFVFENIDTVTVQGKSLIPIYSQEVFSENFYRKHPEKKKKIVIGQKSTNYGEYIDMKAISAAVNRLYEDINIYDNSISAFTMQFVSPVADLGPTFYMYFIQDTIESNGEKLVKLYYTPRNPEDLLFQGTLYITLDGNYAISKAVLEVSKHINLNFIRNFKVNQTFEKGSGGHYHLDNSDMIALFNLIPNTPGMVGERIVNVKNLTDSIIPGYVLHGSSIDTFSRASHQPDSFWRNERSIPLRPAENTTYANADSLVKMRSYNRLMDFMTLLTAGYKSFGKFEIGRIGNFYSFNPVEGNRLQFGARSKPSLSTRYYGDGFIAYGFKDQRWKYVLRGTYSFNNKSIYTFPFNYLQVSYLHDTRNLGVEDLFSQGNSFLSSFNRGLNNMWLYNDIFRLSYVHETDNHFSYILGTKYWQQQTAGSLAYTFETTPNKLDTVKQITTGELSATLRWAPHEQFYQGKATRLDIINKYPIITFQYAKGIYGLFGGQYNYDAFHLSVYKRVYLNPFGFSDVRFTSGYLAGSLPYPLLIIQPGNQSYAYSETSYNVMRIGEFMSDHFAALHIDHFMNGFFLNKIPLLKKLRLREVLNLKILYGGLRDENNPSVNSQQMKFPIISSTSSTFALGCMPYFEGGVGIYNIFSFLRVDLVKRFSYLNHPGISTLGLLFSGNFNF